MSNQPSTPVILSLGQCSADNWRLSRAVKKIAGVEFVTASTADEALDKAAEGVHLVLVNRILDADGTAGVDFIAAARQRGITVPLMLVSDYEDAQAQAIANGALPGFGKSQLGEAQVVERIRKALQIS